MKKYDGIHLVSEFHSIVKYLRTLTKHETSSEDWAHNCEKYADVFSRRSAHAFLGQLPFLGAMYAPTTEYANWQLKYLRSLPDWECRRKPALREDVFGMPTPSLHFPQSSDMLIHHSYHAALFENLTKFRLDQFDFIVEFGGGYGSFCRLTDRLGFDGRYIIYDLPASNAVQRLFLKAVGLSVAPDIEKSDTNEVTCTSDRSFVFEEIRRMIGQGKRGLLVATWSLSETPISARTEWEGVINLFSAHLIAYQCRHLDLENASYFKRIVAEHSAISWISHPTPDGGGEYLFGRKSSAPD